MHFASAIVTGMVLVLPAVAGGCAWTDAPSASSIDACARDGTIPPGLVTTDGEGRFIAGGTPFVPRGIGSYPLLDLAGNGRMDAVDQILDEAVALGRPLVRTNAFFDGSDNPARIRNDDGTIHPPGLLALDRVVAAATARRVRLILVLTNNWTDYGGAAAVVQAVAPTGDLSKDAFWSDPRALDAQRTYVTTLVKRINTVDGRAYADDPTVFAWELANEARCDVPSMCGSNTLAGWAHAMADAVRAGGARQLVSWGGAGYVGDHGEDLNAIALGGAVDVLTVHIYPFANESVRVEDRMSTERLTFGIALGRDTINARAALAQSYRMPLLVEELGWRPTADRADRDGERAIVLGAWLDTADHAQVGTVPWMIGERGRPDYDGLLIRPEQDLASVGALRCK